MELVSLVSGADGQLIDWPIRWTVAVAGELVKTSTRESKNQVYIYIIIIIIIIIIVIAYCVYEFDNK